MPSSVPRQFETDASIHLVPKPDFNIYRRTLILLTPHGKLYMQAPFSDGATR